MSKVSEVPDSAATTVTVSVTVATALDIVIVAVAGVKPNIPCESGSSFHSLEPTGLEPSSGYPKANDTDSDNTGKGTDVITYKFEWTTAQINTASGNPITGGCILDTDATPADGVKILTHWNFATPASFHKTSTDTLTLYVNHTMNGV